MSLLSLMNNPVPIIEDNDSYVKSFWDISPSTFYRNSISMPAANIRQTEDEYIIELAVPGLEREDFDIQLGKNDITITVEKKESKEEEKEKSSYKEFSYYSFKRNFKLPKGINVENVKATYDKGILEVKLEKLKEELKKEEYKKITVE